MASRVGELTGVFRNLSGLYVSTCTILLVVKHHHYHLSTICAGLGRLFFLLIEWHSEGGCMHHRWDFWTSHWDWERAMSTQDMLFARIGRGLVEKGGEEQVAMA